jgi:TonB family protein
MHETPEGQGIQSVRLEVLRMTWRLVVLLCFAFTVCLTVLAETEPVLTSANIPKYPPLACQARVEGIVKVSFTLLAHSGEPTNVEVVSGHPMLNAAAIENIKTWRFDNPYVVDRKYETTFKYRLSGKELPGGSTKRLTVSLESFRQVEIVTDAYEPTVNY